MPQFLFVVEVPPGPVMSSEPAHSHEYTEFLREANKILAPLKKVDCVPLGNAARLISASNNWQVLMGLSTTAGSHKLSYSVSLLQSDAIHITKP